MDTQKLPFAIDGPAGAGKSSISKVVANELGYLLYRYRFHVSRLCYGQFLIVKSMLRIKLL